MIRLCSFLFALFFILGPASAHKVGPVTEELSEAYGLDPDF